MDQETVVDKGGFAADAAKLFSGPGEVRALAQTFDWRRSPLGPTTTWSPALRTMVRSIFDSPFPICLWSGPEYALVYNDAYRRILNASHPSALGQPGSIVWAEIWDGLQTQFDGVRAGGDSINFENVAFVMARLDSGGTETNPALSTTDLEDMTRFNDILATSRPARLRFEQSQGRRR